MFQLLSAIAHVHQSGVFHRDIKPENLLLQLDNFIPPSSTSTTESSPPSSRPGTSSAAYLTPSLKLADFGQARDIRSRPPYTEYVSTRWYRAPEQLLHSTSYNSPIDVWAAGCIMAELHTRTPLFAGNNESDTLQRIVNVIPPPAAWSEGQQGVQRLIGMATGGSTGRGAAAGTGRDGLKRSVSGASELALDLMTAMLHWDPKCRASARDALLHPFFDGLKQTNGKEEEWKEEAKYDGDRWDGDTADDEDAVVQLSADGTWLTARNGFGELRSRYFPHQIDTTTAVLNDKQHYRLHTPMEEQERNMTPQQQKSTVAPHTAKSGVNTIASQLDWPSFSDDSDDDILAAPTRFSHTNSRSSSSMFNSTSRLSPTRSTELTKIASDFTSTTSSTRSCSTAVHVAPLPANSLSRPSSVLSTQRSRRSFASVGSQMFTST